MKHFAFLLFFFSLCLAVRAQNRELRGKVLFQNSGKKPAVSVKVSASGANSVYTTSSGEFVLIYPNKASGDPATLNIGFFDVNNTALELVNAEVVSNARIPADPNEELLIFVCRAGQRAESRLHYYNLCEPGVIKSYEVLKAEKKKLLAGLHITNQEKIKLRLQIDSLDEELRESLNKLDELSTYISSINRDFASELVKAALQKLEEDQDVEAARRILNPEKLKQLYDISLKKKVTAEKEIAGVIEGLELSVKLLSSLMPRRLYYKEIISTYQMIIDIQEESKIEGADPSFSYYYLAATYIDDGQYSRGLETARALRHKILTSSAKVTIETGVLYIANLAAMGEAFLNLHQIDSALVYFDKGLSFTKLIGRVRDSTTNEAYYIILGSIYNNMAKCYNANKRFEKAIETELLAISTIEERYGKEAKDLDIHYDECALAFYYSGDTKKALEYQKHSFGLKINKAKTHYSFKSADWARAFENYYMIANAVYGPGHSFSTLLQAKSLYELSLDSADIRLANVYYKIASYYGTYGPVDSAAFFYLKAADIYRSNDDISNYRLNTGEYYEAKGLIKALADNYKDAIPYFDSAYFLNRKVSSLYLLGVAHERSKNYQVAIDCFKKALVADTAKTEKYIVSNLGLAHASSGQLPEAYKYFQEFEDLGVDTPLAYRNWAVYYALKGNKEKAIEYLEKAVGGGYNNLKWLNSEPGIQSLRSDERFKKILGMVRVK